MARRAAGVNLGGIDKKRDGRSGGVAGSVVIPDVVTVKGDKGDPGRPGGAGPKGDPGTPYWSTEAPDPALHPVWGVIAEDPEENGAIYYWYNGTGPWVEMGTIGYGVGDHEAASDPHPQYLLSAAAAELIRDTIASALVAGANITITPNDGGDTITIAATGGGASVVDSIADGDTANAPSRNAVFDALAGKSDTGHGHSNVVAGGAAGYMTGTDKTKLDGIATGATANSADATLLDRANHTGTQGSSSISNFAATVRTTTLSGLSITDSAIVATDHLLAAAGKTQGQLNSRVAGSYTPTATNIANAGSITPGVFSYVRIQNVVRVAGSVTLTPAAAATLTQVELTLPVASDLTVNGDLSGTATPAVSTPVPGYVHGVPATDRARLNYVANSTGSQVVYLHFQYFVN